MTEPRCFGTTQYNPKTSICSGCRYRVGCATKFNSVKNRFKLR